VRQVATLGALLTGAALAGCGLLSTDPIRGVEVRTDDAAYEVGAAISVQIRNFSERDAYFHHCDHRVVLVIEGRAGSGWNEVLRLGEPCQAIYESGVTRLRPGESHTLTVTLEAEGTFRVRVLTGPTDGSIGYNVVYSPAFTVGAEAG
jgi:hypothetical protein